jgi:hypothetical protein
MFIDATSVRYITERREGGTVSLKPWIFVKKLLLNFTFMLPCIVIDFFLNNQPVAAIIQIYSVIKLHMFRASSLEDQDGAGSILTLLGSGHQKPA